MRKELRDIKPPQVFTHCIDEEKGNCPYLFYNSHGAPCCGIDNVVGVWFFGCIPSVTLQKEKEKIK